MTTGKGGSELIFLEEENKFLVCCSGINHFFWLLGRARIARIFLLSPLWSCFLLELFFHDV